MNRLAKKLYKEMDFIAHRYLGTENDWIYSRYGEVGHNWGGVRVCLGVK